MKCSVVIPSLNSTVIPQTIAALLPQIASEDEVLIIGLDSQKHVQESLRVRFIDTSIAVSPAAARNIGIKMAKGEIICFLDADCIPNPKWLIRIKNRFQDSAVDVLGGGIDTNQTGFWSWCDHISTFHDYLATAPSGPREQLPSLNLTIRKSALSKVGDFDECYPRPAGEDSDLTTRLRANGYTLVFDPGSTINHVPSRSQFSSSLKHAWQLGYYSIKVDKRWRSFLKPPPVLRNRILLFISSPLLALGVTVRVFLENRSLWRYWYAVLGVFILKTVWCWGAATGMDRKPLTTSAGPEL